MITPPSSNAFLGTGLMGEPMAQNLLRARFRLKVWNRTASKTDGLVAAGAELALSPADAAREVDAVILMLENGAVVTELLFKQGVAAGCRRGTLVIDMSSIAPAIAEDHARPLTGMGLPHRCSGLRRHRRRRPGCPGDYGWRRGRRPGVGCAPYCEHWEP